VDVSKGRVRGGFNGRFAEEAEEEDGRRDQEGRGVIKKGRSAGEKNEKYWRREMMRVNGGE
jgi:hypothetical protein